MPEILTESFCERCGTRYTFEAAIPKKRRIGKLKVFSKGLKNYVLSDDASLDEALAEARSEEQRELTGGQLDAFHQAFQFCMSCRQYTCSNCWNETEGRCLTCAPLSVAAGQFGSPLDDLLAGGGMAPLISQPVDTDPAHTHAPNGTANGNGHALLNEPPPPAMNGTAWPTIDLFRSEDAGPDVEPPAESVMSEPEAVASAATVGDVDVAPEAAPAADFWAHPFTGFAPVVESTNGHDPETLPDAGTADEPLTVEQPPIVEPDVERIASTVSPMIDDEPAWPTEPGPAVEASPVEAQAPVVDATSDARADELAARTSRLLGRFRIQLPSADAAPAQPIPLTDGQPQPTGELAPEPVGELVPEPIVAGTDRVEMPAWPTPAVPAWRSPTPPIPAPAGQVQASLQPARIAGEAPQWPAPLRPGVDLTVPAPWASGGATRDAGPWIASAQEVAAASSQAAVPGGIQSCVSCGLSLSATARFCRRCGSRQV